MWLCLFCEMLLVKKLVFSCECSNCMCLCISGGVMLSWLVMLV